MHMSVIRAKRRATRRMLIHNIMFCLAAVISIMAFIVFWMAVVVYTSTGF